MTVPQIPFKFSNIRAEFGSNMPTTSSSFKAYRKWYSTATGGYYVGVTNSTTNISTGTPVLSMKTFAGEAATYIVSTSTYSTGTTTIYYETIPSGTKSVTIEIWGAGGGSGSNTSGSPTPPAPSATGGASGGYGRSVYSISGTNWGQTFSVRVGVGGPSVSGTSGPLTGFTGNPGGATTVTNSTFNLPFTLSAGGGAGGAGDGVTPITPSTGGTAGTGANAPTPPVNSKAGLSVTGGTINGAAVTTSSIYGYNGYGAGGQAPAGGAPSAPGGAGSGGGVIFRYS